MSIPVKVLACISLFAFTIAALVRFTDANDTDTVFSKIAEFIKKLLKWQRLDKPYSLTRIGLIIGFVFGILSIMLS